MTDQLQRFIFEHADVRGEIAQLEHSYHKALLDHDYHPEVARLLGEFIVAAALLSATIKFDGRLTLQARSEGSVPLIMAECSSEQALRGIARQADTLTATDFYSLLQNGQLSITIEPRQGQRYQGIVSLNGANLAACLQEYFEHSEQLSTRFWLACDGQRAAGLMLQELPTRTPLTSADLRAQQWEHLTHLAQTITTAELTQLPFAELLHRLYHQDPLRLFEPKALHFECSCSEQRTLEALRTLGQAELDNILAEQGAIEIKCEFCNHQYRFDAAAIHPLFQQNIH